MGDIRLGSTDIQALYLGSTALTKVYLGTTEIWSSGPPPSTLTLDLDFRLNWGAPLDDAIIAGPSSLTFSRADTVATGWDENGLLKLARQQNALDYSEDFGQASWILGGNATRQLNTDVAPDGTTTADTITDIGSGYGDVHNTGTVGTTPVCISVYIKKDTDQTRFPELQMRAANGTMGLYAVQINTETGDTIPRDLGSGSPDAYGVISDGSYWRMWISHANADTTRVTWQIHPAVTTSWGAAENAAAGSVVVWGAQLENSSYPQAYTKTEGSAVAVAEIPRFDHDPSNNVAKGVLIEGAATNECLQSEDFDTTWIKGGGITSAQDETAPDGTATAWTLTDANAGDFAFVYQSPTIPGNSSFWCFSCFVKKDSDETRFPGFGMRVDGTTIWALLNTATGAVGAITGQVFDDIGVIDAGAWWRVYAIKQGSTATNGRIEIYPALTTTWNGSTETAAQGSIVAWGAQLENTAYPTSYIATAASSVTRAAEQLTTTDVSWFNSDWSGSMLCDMRTGPSTGVTRLPWSMIGNPTGSRHSLYFRTTNTQLRVDFAGASPSLLMDYTKPPFENRNLRHLSAIASSGDDAEVYVDGASEATDTSYGFPTNPPDEFRIGVNYQGVSHMKGHIGVLKYWQERRTDGDTLTAIVPHYPTHLSATVT